MIYNAIDTWNSSPDSYLEHHGVKGMKWGVRHDVFGIQKRRHRKLAQALEVAKREKNIINAIINTILLLKPSLVKDFKI